MTGLLQDYVTEQADRRGDAVALVMAGEELQYAELELASNRLAHLLQAVGCRPGDRVCLLAEKSPQTIVGMLAALKAGCAYVPIDTASPAPRVGRVVRAADPAAVSSAGGVLLEALLSDGALAPSVPAGALNADLITSSPARFAFEPRDHAAQADQPPGVRVGETDPAHLLFTSGSTGEPKGVVITHHNVRSFVEWAVRYFRTQPGDRISGHPPLHFDLSTFDIYGTFHAGAQLHLVPRTALLPQHLAAFISEAQLTQWFSVPSAMTYMAKLGAVPDAGFPSLQRVLWCGEVLPTPVLIHWMERIPQARFTNLYGPTEATIASSYYTLPGVPSDPSAPIPIGRACAGEELLVLDERLEAAADGVPGDLYIGGAGLSPGYWRDDAKTAAAFVADPRPEKEGERLYRTGDLARVDESGQLQFLGRTDSQIKSRGYRIELGEIEAAINALPQIAECAVVGAPSDGFEGTAICCAFAPAREARVSVPELRAAAGTVLPAYMLPSHWLPMDALPKNVNGKIDRRRLRELGTPNLNGARDEHS
jgi:amino acid adenylation domain-containing protein